MLALLLIFLLFSVVINYFLFNRELIAPAFLFSVSFFISVPWALLYKKKWSLDISSNTFMVILGGVVTFMIVSLVVDRVSILIEPRINMEVNHSNFKEISKMKSIIVLVLELITVVLTIKYIKNVAPSGSLSESIDLYRWKTSDNIDLPSMDRYLSWLRTFTDASGIFFSYIVSRNIILLKKISYIDIMIFLVSACSGYLLGSRGSTVLLIVGLLVYIYFSYFQKKSNIFTINTKTLVVISISFVLLVLTFQVSASFLGREISNYSMSDYLSIYFGAEIKNLDTFLTGGSFPVKTSFFGEQTFIYLHQAIDRIIGNGNNIRFILPFLNVNGYSLGNVYTTFYPYIYDFGYVGVPILVGFMAFTSQIIYIRSKREIVLGKDLPVYVLIYGRISACLLLSFFSNKFYENIFSVNFIEMILVWIVLITVLPKKGKIINYNEV
ncbi:O-antigen polymerase [Companilactobacillus nuruki]|nr:O-antigen polymerase [Companilactobacillus nuruki]